MLKSIGYLGAAVAAASALAIGLLTACATPPAQAPSPRLAAGLPPSLRLAAPPPADRGLAVQASAFESFMRHARGIDAGFSGPGDVAQALPRSWRRA
jgi:hypothetical protein